LTRDIPAADADGKTYLPIITYKVSITTGKVRGAGTDSNVFVILYGENGDSGRNQLDAPITAFEKGKTDVFRIRCTDLGQLVKIRIGHDGTGIGSGWFCEIVNIDGNWSFPCNRWFDISEDDHSIERDLILGGKPGRTLVNYRIIVIIGTEGRVDKARLDNEKDNFERGYIDIFSIETLDIGEIKQIVIGHDGKGLGSAWLCDKVFVVNERETPSNVGCSPARNGSM